MEEERLFVASKLVYQSQIVFTHMYGLTVLPCLDETIPTFHSQLKKWLLTAYYPRKNHLDLGVHWELS